MRPAQLLTVLEREFLSTQEGHHTPVMLWGPPGVGKSQMVTQIGQRHGMPVIDIRLSQMEPSDLRGIPFRVGELVEWAVPAMLPDAQRHGGQGILFLDEITSVPPSVSAAAYQLILDRRLGYLRGRQSPGGPGRHLYHARAARQPLFPLRGRCQPGRLGGLGVRQQHRRAPDRLSALPARTAV